jgi:hypothetical protein
MPMERDRYPKNWFAISTEVKTAANAYAKRERKGQLPLPLTNHPSHETYD